MGSWPRTSRHRWTITWDLKKRRLDHHRRERHHAGQNRWHLQEEYGYQVKGGGCTRRASRGQRDRSPSRHREPQFPLQALDAFFDSLALGLFAVVPADYRTLDQLDPGSGVVVRLEERAQGNFGRRDLLVH